MSIKKAILNDIRGNRNNPDGKENKNMDKPPFKNNLSNHGDLRALLIKNKLDRLFYLKDLKEEERAGLHASSIIVSDNEFCYREQVLSLFYKQNQGEEIPINLIRIFAAGNSIHSKWQNMFVKSGIAVEIEARNFSEKYELYFTPDAVINLDGTKYVVEIKSMNTFAYQKADSHPAGQKQIQLYMHLLGIPQGFILVEDKNNQEWKPFLQQYDYFQVIPFLKRLEQIQKLKKIFLERNEIPPRKCKNSEVNRAKRCNMRDACWNIGIGRCIIADKKKGVDRN